jgi:hypothetical protein
MNQPPGQKRQLKIDVSATGFGRIEIEGQDVSNSVSGFTIRGGVRELTTAELDIVAPRGATFNGMARIEITPELRAIMLAAGWTPPVEDAS